MFTTTVAPRKLHSYYRLLAWLDQTIGRGLSMLVLGGAGVLAIIVWQLVRTEPARPISLNRPFETFLALVALSSSLAGPALLMATALGAITWLVSRPARRTGKIVRIDTMVMGKWLSRLGKFGLTHDSRRATRWLLVERPEQLIAANNAWLSAENANPDLRNYYPLDDALDNLAREYKEQRIN